MSVYIPRNAQACLISVVRDLVHHYDEQTELARAIIIRLGERNVPAEFVAMLRPYVTPFAAAVIARQIDPFAEQPPETSELPPEPDQTDRTRALIEQLIHQTRLYADSASVKELLAFVNRLRSFAPFNAMLLHIQKPGLTYAASASDWWHAFGRIPKGNARPLIVLRTMGPVDFVFDVLDTEGRPLPDGAFSFPVIGAITQATLDDFLSRVRSKGITIDWMDAGDGFAGVIGVSCQMQGRTVISRDYSICLNQNHKPSQIFVTLCHELAHLYLGHLGPDPRLKIPERASATHPIREIEAETVAYVVGHRNGICPQSESYLDAFKDDFSDMDFHAVMRAANAIETLMARPASAFRKQ